MALQQPFRIRVLISYNLIKLILIMDEDNFVYGKFYQGKRNVFKFKFGEFQRGRSVDR